MLRSIDSFIIAIATFFGHGPQKSNTPYELEFTVGSRLEDSPVNMMDIYDSSGWYVKNLHEKHLVKINFGHNNATSIKILAHHVAIWAIDEGIHFVELAPTPSEQFTYSNAKMQCKEQMKQLGFYEKTDWSVYDKEDLAEKLTGGTDSYTYAYAPAGDSKISCGIKCLYPGLRRPYNEVTNVKSCMYFIRVEMRHDVLKAKKQNR